MGLHDRLRRLEQSGAYIPPEVTHGLGVPREVVEAEWERVFGPLPALIARQAQRIAERCAAGENLDDLIGGSNDIDLMSLAVSFGSPETVPKPVRDALEDAAQRAGTMGEGDVAMMRAFYHAAITDAFELLDAEQGAEQ